MSYTVYLQDADGVVTVAPHAESGTYRLGGSDQAELHVTYNYGRLIRQHLHPDGLRWLDGQRAVDTTEALARAVWKLGDTPYRGPHYVLRYDRRRTPVADALGAIVRAGGAIDAPEHADLLRQGLDEGCVYDTGGYWKATPGNAGHALAILLAWSRQHPEAVWCVS